MRGREKNRLPPIRRCAPVQWPQQRDERGAWREELVEGGVPKVEPAMHPIDGGLGSGRAPHEDGCNGQRG